MTNAFYKVSRRLVRRQGFRRETAAVPPVPVRFADEIESRAPQSLDTAPTVADY
ncbi:MAG: hypothetical protein JW888_06905 [Pirellulales bacterium]|nr:hypothetical protein [Pirellulales bacterium]